MTTQSDRAIARYRKSLQQALRAAPREVRSSAIQDAEEFLLDEVQAMDVGRLTSEAAAFTRFVDRFGSPDQLAAGYLQQADAKAPPARCTSAWNRIAAILLLAIVSTGGVCFAMLREPPKLSPFTEVTFAGDQINVTYQGRRYQWLELNDLSVEEIVAAAKKQFGDRWEKRVAEDLVEVLWGMDHEPQDTVRLRLIDLETNAETVVDAAAMTAENRRALYTKRLLAEQSIKLPAEQPPKLSPFTEVTFEVDQINVTYQGHVYQWIELDELSIEEIVASAKKQFGDRWEKRVAEDLVEVLQGMDHDLKETVRLRLIDPETKAEKVVDAAAMTAENRRQLYLKRYLAGDESLRSN